MLKQRRPHDSADRLIEPASQLQLSNRRRPWHALERAVEAAAEVDCPDSDRPRQTVHALIEAATRFHAQQIAVESQHRCGQRPSRLLRTEGRHACCESIARASRLGQPSIDPNIRPQVPWGVGLHSEVQRADTPAREAELQRGKLELRRGCERLLAVHCLDEGDVIASGRRLGPAARRMGWEIAFLVFPRVAELFRFEAGGYIRTYV